MQIERQMGLCSCLEKISPLCLMCWTDAVVRVVQAIRASSRWGRAALTPQQLSRTSTMPPTRDALGSQAEWACHGPHWVTATSERRLQQLLKPHLLLDIPAVLKKLEVPQSKPARLHCRASGMKHLRAHFILSSGTDEGRAPRLIIRETSGREQEEKRQLVQIRAKKICWET